MIIKNTPFIGEEKPIVYLVSTPIGNIEDISLRALRILKEADIIACEDTRNTSLLLKRLEIDNKKLVSLYSQTEAINSVKLLNKIKEDRLILCYCSDAGMATISDPGGLLVKTAYEMNIKVSIIPGANACLSALAISGIDSSDFTFFGFLPTKVSSKKKFLEELIYRKETLIFYESPNRIKETISVLNEVFPKDRKVAVVRELTKIHEEVVTGSISELNEYEGQFKGEIVLIIEGSKVEEKMSDDKIILLLKEGLQKESLASLSKSISKISNRSKKEIYQLGLKIK